jgi:hypothetical protein
MAKNVTGNRDGLPCIAWISAESRRQLDQICTGLNAVPERFCGALLDEAIEAHIRGRQQLSSTTTTDDPPVADHARAGPRSRSQRTTGELAELTADFESGTKGIGKP